MSDFGSSRFDRRLFDQGRRNLVELLNGGGMGHAGLDQFIGHAGLAISFAERDGRLVVEFGTQVSWLALTPQQAADLAAVLVRSALALARKNGDTVVRPAL